MDEPQPSASDEVPEEIRELVKPELHPGERLLWAGRGNPRPHRTVTVGNPFVAPLFAAGSFFLSGVFLAAYLGAFGKAFERKSDESAVFMFGIIAGGIGCLLVTGIVGGRVTRQREHHRTAKSLYALTDRRAIIWNPRKGTDAVEVFSYPCGKIAYVHRVEYPDGSGDVNFRFADEEHYWGPVGFEGVEEVRRVEELVRRTLTRSEPGPAA